MTNRKIFYNLRIYFNIIWMKTHQREILIYYNPESRSDRQTVAMARDLSSHVRAFAYGKTPSTETDWRSIIQTLNCDPKDLLNKADPYYQNHIRGRNFDEEGWVKIFRFNTHLIRKPIAMRGRRVIMCNTPSDIHRLVHR